MRLEKELLTQQSANQCYKDFEQFVRVYFGYFGGFATLFNNSSNFDEEKLHNLMTNKTSDNSTGAYIKDMSRSIVISNVTELLLLRHTVNANIFNYRDPSGESYEDSDVSFNARSRIFQSVIYAFYEMNVP